MSHGILSVFCALPGIEHLADSDRRPGVAGFRAFRPVVGVLPVDVLAGYSGGIILAIPFGWLSKLCSLSGSLL